MQYYIYTSWVSPPFSPFGKGVEFMRYVYAGKFPHPRHGFASDRLTSELGVVGVSGFGSESVYAF